MKIIITYFLLCSVVFGANAQKIPQKVAAVIKPCADEHGIKLGDDEKIQFKDLSEGDNCFVNCVMEKVGVMKDGNFQKSELVNLLPELSSEKADKLNAAIDKCVSEASTKSACDKSFSILKCMTAQKSS